MSYRAVARVLSLDGRWLTCEFFRGGREPAQSCWVEQAEELIVGGMSGSPIITSGGTAFALVTSNGPNPILISSLPGWMVADFLQRPAERSIA